MGKLLPSEFGSKEMRRQHVAMLQFRIGTCQESGILSSTTLEEVSGVVEDMIKVSTEDGQVLESGPVASLLQV